MDYQFSDLIFLSTAQAGLYTLKFLGYHCLKNDDSKEGDICLGEIIPKELDERKKLTLNFYKKGAMLPTPLDFLYWIEKSRNYIKKISETNSDNNLPSLNEPYSKKGRVLEFVDSSLESQVQEPYSYLRKTELVN